MRISSATSTQKTRDLQGKQTTPHESPQLWTVGLQDRHFAALSTPFLLSSGLWTTCLEVGPSILVLRAAGFTGSLHSFEDEADLSAERAPTEAEAWLPRPHVHTRRPGDPEAPPRQGAQAPVGLSRSGVQRKHRLSRSRDFDAVYRRGHSVSTPVPDALLVREARRARRAAARPRRPEGGRQRRRAQPDQAPAARDLAREARRRVDRPGERLRPRRAARPAGGRRGPRPRVA